MEQFIEKLREVQWGFMTPTHIASLILAVAIIVGLYFILRKKSEKVQRIVLFILSWWGPAAVVYNIVVWGMQPSSTVLEYLPLHLCSVNAILLPVLVLTKNNFLGNLLPVYSVGAIAALSFNTIQAEWTIIDPELFMINDVLLMFFMGHVFEFGIPMLMLVLGLVKIKPRYIAPCLAATFGMYTAIHFCNLGLNKYLLENPIIYNGENMNIQVNYMFSLYHDGNPVLKLFWDILPGFIPKPYFYMLATLPIFAIVYTLMNLGSIIRYFKNKKARREGEVEEAPEKAE